MKNYNGTLLEQYIIALENPDSVGWDSKTKTWTHATGKGMDCNQIGIGGDRYNKNIRAIIGTQNWDKVRLTEAQEREARYKNFDYFNGVYDRNTKGLSLSNNKRMLAMGLLYHGFGKLLWKKDHTLNKTLRYGSDEDFSRVISEFYSDKYPERARSHNKFMEQLKKKEETAKRKRRFSLEEIYGSDGLTNYVTPIDATRVSPPSIKKRFSLEQMVRRRSLRSMK